MLLCSHPDTVQRSMPYLIILSTIKVQSALQIYASQQALHPAFMAFGSRDSLSPRGARLYYFNLKIFIYQTIISSSILSSLLYFAVRSARDIEPVLICPELTATAKSAINVSSVSPERCEIIVL